MLEWTPSALPTQACFNLQPCFSNRVDLPTKDRAQSQGSLETVSAYLPFPDRPAEACCVAGLLSCGRHRILGVNPVFVCLFVALPIPVAHSWVISLYESVPKVFLEKWEIPRVPVHLAQSWPSA